MVQASAEKLEHTGPAEKESVASVPQKEQLARMPEPPLPKGKGTEYQIMREERVKVNESCTSVSEREIRARAWRGKGALQSEERQVPRRKGRASKKSLPRKICRVLVLLQVWPNLKWERRLGDEEPTHKMKK